MNIFQHTERTRGDPLIYMLYIFDMMLKIYYYKTRIIITTSFILAGFILFFLMLVLTRKKNTGGIERDERDMLISRKASEISLAIVMGYIFFTCIILYSIYGETNSVPRGWMWFLAYTCFFAIYISNSAINLILYRSKADIQ